MPREETIQNETARRVECGTSVKEYRLKKGPVLLHQSNKLSFESDIDLFSNSDIHIVSRAHSSLPLKISIYLVPGGSQALRAA